MSQQVRYQDSNEVFYDDELWGFAERKAEYIFTDLPAEYGGDWKSQITDFLDAHAVALNIEGLGDKRQAVYDSPNVAIMRENVTALMEQSRQLIPRIQQMLENFEKSLDKIAL